MRRRGALLVLVSSPAAAAGGASGSAPDATKIHRIGWLGFDGFPPGQRALFEANLAANGLTVGRNAELLTTDAGGDVAKLPARVAELVQQRVDVIVAGGSQAAAAAMRHAFKVPVVFYFVADARRAGLVADLARPGGMVTGFGGHGTPLQTKNLQLLRELMPELRKVAVVSNPDFPVHQDFVVAAAQAAQALGIEVLPAIARDIGELPQALAAARQGGARAVLLLPQPRFAIRGPEVARAIAEARLPAISAVLDDARAGVLMAYGWHQDDDLARVPEYLRRILSGTPPGELPVQQPARFRLILNRRTAQALGLTLPRSLLVHADEVIE